jgi:hypothetical protein
VVRVVCLVALLALACAAGQVTLADFSIFAGRYNYAWER